MSLELKLSTEDETKITALTGQVWTCSTPSAMESALKNALTEFSKISEPFAMYYRSTWADDNARFPLKQWACSSWKCDESLQRTNNPLERKWGTE